MAARPLTVTKEVVARVKEVVLRVTLVLNVLARIMLAPLLRETEFAI
jgi:hypothetical protein